MVFFHEIFHTRLMGGEPIYDPPNDSKNPYLKSVADISVNRIRRQLGASYGIRQNYAPIIRTSISKYIEGKGWEAFSAMDKQSLRDIKQNKVPTGKHIVSYYEK